MVIDCDEKNKIIIVAPDDTVISKSVDFRKMISHIQGDELNITFISPTGIKSSVLKTIDRYEKKKLNIKDFKYSVFKTDIRKNIYVPKHTVVDDEKQLLSSLKTNKENLPKIRQDDPQVIWCNANVGQIIKIERIDTVGKLLYYRVVV